ncbi:MAG: HAD family hydrolase [bacterium]|nr:HAD family hydrolase [bacterium]
MINKYKHISFDLDGTLIHTMPEYRHRVVPVVIKQLGGNIADEFVIDRFWFESGRSEIIKNHFNLNPDKFWELFHIIDTPEQRSAHTQAYEDAEPTFRKLKDLGKTISIITGAPRKIAQIEIKKLNGAPHDFYFSIADSEFSEKPDPSSFHHTLEQLCLKPEETVYVGNSSEDAYYAKNTGVDFIYLNRKEHKFDLKEYATAIIHSLDELFA